MIERLEHKWAEKVFGTLNRHKIKAPNLIVYYFLQMLSDNLSCRF